ncbi:response regulator transcription factor [Clostridioides difficile]
MNKILIIDDDIELCELLKKCVSRESIHAYTCHCGKDGLNAVLNDNFQLIVLDVMMPELDGFEILKKIRKISSVPVLMLTSKTENSDKIHGLRSGADDYLTKPFNIDEFIARVLSLIRRYTTLNHSHTEKSSILSFKGLSIDLDNCVVTVSGKQIELPIKEFEVLRYLAENQGRILTKKQIYEEVWKEQYAYDDANLMGYISRLRKKIDFDTDNPSYIQTVKGMGYRFNREV